MYYYKQIDENGEITSVLTCDTYLRESETQIEITKEEYDEYIASLPEPEEPEPASWGSVGTVGEGDRGAGLAAAGQGVHTLRFYRERAWTI